MDDEITDKQETNKEWEEGEYEAFLKRFRWMQQHGEPSQSDRDRCLPYRGEH